MRSNEKKQVRVPCMNRAFMGDVEASGISCIFNVTRNPHALWVVQQLREAWAYQQTHRFLLIILNERHLKRLLSSYLLYYHEDRTPLGLAKDTPAGRATKIRSAGESKIQSFPRLGGLHHRYAVGA
jgi:hypothetical protein